MVTCLSGLTVLAVPMATELLLEAPQVSGGCRSCSLLQTATNIFFRYVVTLGSWRVTKVRDHLRSEELSFTATKERDSCRCADSSMQNSLEVRAFREQWSFFWLALNCGQEETGGWFERSACKIGHQLWWQ